jgi:hypothetical protein
MDDIYDFLKPYRQRLLRYLDANEKIPGDEPGPLEFVYEVLDAWSRFAQNRQLPEPSAQERTFWFSLYQLEELVEDPVRGQLDPYEGILMQNLAMAREALKQWKKLPQGLYATRPGE